MALANIIGTVIQQHGLILSVQVGSLGEHLASLAHDVLLDDLSLVPLVPRVVGGR